MKPKTNRRGKEREIDKDTVVAYHEFLQGRIQGELNGVTIGPGYTLSRFAAAFFIFGLACMVVGILVITLRHRHVYLISWDDQFLGPFFIIMFLLSCSVATGLLLLAKRRTNQYRKDLAFRPIGDYGVAVVHKSKLNYDDQKRTELKSGTTPHNVRHPGRSDVNDRGNRGDYSRNRGYDNRGYRDDYGRRPNDPEKRRERDRERDRDYREGRGRDDRPRDRPPRRDGDRDRDRERRPRPPEGERRRDDRERGRRPPDDRPRPPRGPDDDKRRAEARRKYEEDKRRRYEEDRRRAELRKQAEAESYDRMARSPSQERGIDVDEGTRTYQIQTTVKLSQQIQDTDESEL